MLNLKNERGPADMARHHLFSADDQLALPYACRSHDPDVGAQALGMEVE